MDTRLLAVIAIVGPLTVWAVWFLGRAVRLRQRLGGDRLVTCPENGCSALVHIDVALAVTGSAGSAPAPLDACSRWAERGGCSQPCLHEAHRASSQVGAVVRAWADGRACATCGRPASAGGGGPHVALLQPDGTTREWADVLPDELALALATSLPVCRNCHVASTFRRLHPELVTDRDVRTSV